MKFEEAVKFMEDGLVCRHCYNHTNYRVKEDELQYELNPNEWRKSRVELSYHFKGRWELVEAKLDKISVAEEKLKKIKQILED